MLKKDNLMRPLKANEVGYVFTDKIISLLVRAIRNKNYGSYLVGGIVGTGKTSQIEIASKIAEKDSLVIHVSFYDQEECKISFERIVLSGLIRAVEKKWQGKIPDSIAPALYQCKESLLYEMSETKQEERSNEKEKKNGYSNEFHAFGNVKIQLKNILSVFADGKRTDIEAENGLESHHIKSVIHSTKIQRKILEDIYELLSVISDTTIILIYDEFDKMDENILNVLFSKYKELFVEKDVFNFFLVDDYMYKKYSDPNLLNNPICSYFVNTYYVPLLALNESLAYMKRMFSEKRYIVGYEVYYKSLGNYRLINQYYLAGYVFDPVNTLKAFIHKKTVEKLKMQYFDSYSIDLMVRKIKMALEEMVRRRSFCFVELSEQLKSKTRDNDTWPDYKKIMMTVIEIILEINEEAIEESDGIINVKLELLFENSFKIFKSIRDEREITRENVELNLIQEEDMYRIWKDKELYFQPRRISVLKEDISPIEIAVNKPDAYMESLFPLVCTGLEDNGIMVIAIRRPWKDSLVKKDYSYTGMVVIDKECFQVAYYIERGCYKSEGRAIFNRFLDEVEKRKVSICKMVATEDFDIETDIESLIRQYNRPNLNRLEDLKIRVENWE